MSTNPIEENFTPKPTGSLEDLFRHHLGEEATVPPRPMLWDHIDNSLLVRQNETYRRRLVATRWVAAASLLLATLAGTGWWAHRAADMAGSELATSRSAGSNGTGGTQSTTTATNGSQVSGISVAGNDAKASVAASASGRKAPADGSSSRDETTRGSAIRGSYSPSQAAVAANPAGHNTGIRSASSGLGLEEGAANVGRGVTSSSSSATMPGTSDPNAMVIAGTDGAARTNPTLAARLAQTGATEGTGLNGASNSDSGDFAGNPTGVASRTVTSGAAANGAAAYGAAATSPTMTSFTQASPVAAPEQVSLLAAQPATLNLANPAALPEGLASVAMPADADAVLAAARKWHYGASYSAGLFNPNINFSRVGIEPEYDYNPALGADSPALTEAAAAQYRENLRPGLSQRLALVAKRHLGGHWSLSTGAEFTQATAKSASASAFVGEQLIDLGQFTYGAMRTTDFRYRMAGIPVELSYGNPEKRGWSLYGRLGGVVSALFGVRSEVEGLPEATRTYSLASTGTPYRRVLGSVRGGAGAQYRSVAGNWGLNLGPVAELGLVPLNAHPAQRFMAQSRPYSFGIEAGVEFGR